MPRNDIYKTGNNIQNGVIKSENFDEYLLPTIKDIPNVKPILLENPDKYGPWGAKVLGEPTLELGAAAINNAFAFACGKHSNAIPLSLERVFLGEDLVKPERQSEVQLSGRSVGGKDCEPPKKQTARISAVSITRAEDLNTALNILEDGKHWILSGGTDVVIQLRKEKHPRKLLDISIEPMEIPFRVHACPLEFRDKGRFIRTDEIQNKEVGI